MKVLLSWLREFAPGIDGDPGALSDVLSALGLTVEEMTVTGAMPGGVVLGRVLDLRPHPDADRIQLVDVDDGSGSTLQVCCGAFNMAVGDLVPLARVGTVMPSGLEIARRKLRGQTSEGMCCSEIELDMGADAEGIMILNDRVAAGAEPGTPLAEALGLEPDVLWDLEVGGQPARRPFGHGRGPRPRSRPGRGLRTSRLVDTRLGSRHLGGRRRGDRRPHAVRPLRRPRAAPRSRRFVAPVDGQPADRAGPAAYQQHRRHLQLRDARVGPAQPHLRPGPGERCPDPGSPGPRRRDDRHPRRPAPDSRLRRRGDRRWRRRRDRHRRGHGRGVHRDRRRDHRRAGRDGVVGPAVHIAHRQAAEPLQRGLDPLPAGRRLGLQRRALHESIRAVGGGAGG